ncbi:hypothetical protein EMCG_08926 [[Emmonsia] crescens]|uniref:Uncharacterized protein n=1 Tax=[Emmonsia] crescens TaxID=73230 RepID=A0A0G2I451_9EURO|nr:hypothetical protein EMCG_08926 [Emmonsia crescens UAMH 3008]
MKLSLVSVSLCAVAGVLAQDTSSGNKLGDILGSLGNHPDGLMHVGADGILRSFDGEGRVIDFARLDSGHLRTAAASWFPGQKEEGLIDFWQNVDSSEVEEDQIWSPPSHLLPPRFSDPEGFAQSELSTPNHQRLSIRRDHVCGEFRCTRNSDCWPRDCTMCVTMRCQGGHD